MTTNNDGNISLENITRCPECNLISSLNLFYKDGKSYLDYKKILKLYDTTNLNQSEIAKECKCSVDSVREIVKDYRGNVNWHLRKDNKNLLNKPMKVRCLETGNEFDSCSQAGKWLVEQGKIKSRNYGKNRISFILISIAFRALFFRKRKIFIFLNIFF